MPIDKSLRKDFVDAYMRQWVGPSLVHTMYCRHIRRPTTTRTNVDLLSAEPLGITFSGIWKCHLQTGDFCPNINMFTPMFKNLARHIIVLWLIRADHSYFRFDDDDQMNILIITKREMVNLKSHIFICRINMIETLTFISVTLSTEYTCQAFVCSMLPQIYIAMIIK